LDFGIHLLFMAVIRNNGRKCLNNSAGVHHRKKVTPAAGVGFTFKKKVFKNSTS